MTIDIGLSRENWEKLKITKINSIQIRSKTKRHSFLAAVRRGNFHPRISNTLLEVLKVADPRVLSNFFGLEWWYHSRSNESGGKLNTLPF